MGLSKLKGVDDRCFNILPASLSPFWQLLIITIFPPLSPSPHFQQPPFLSLLFHLLRTHCFKFIQSGHKAGPIITTHFLSIPPLFIHTLRSSEPQKNPKVANQEEEEKIMGRGKIEIKKIENRTNRQVTFSKRRNGIMKKAQELTVLCDAKVSLIMISCTDKLYQYLSPGADIKKMYDEYQKIMGVDLWATHYEKMQKHEQQLLEINGMLRREINRRMGGDLDDLSFTDLCGLEQEMDGALEVIRNQRVHKVKTQTGTTRKKVKNLEERHGNLLMELDSRFQGPHFALADNDQGGYDTGAGYANDGLADNIYALSRHTCHLNLHQGGPGYGAVHDLRLA